MVQQHPEHRFIFLFDREPHPEFLFAENVEAVTVHPQARHPWLWHVWFEWMLPRVLHQHKADVFLSPDGYLSLSTDVPSLPVIHDLNFLHNPHDLPEHHAKYLNRNFPRFAQKATRIATVSEFSRQDIAASYNIALDLIDVVFNGVSERFRPLSQQEQVLTRAKWTQDVPYLIFVGAMHPRKNIARMLQGYDLFRSTTGSPLKLVMVGSRQHWTADMEHAMEQMHFRDDVVFAGRVSENDLSSLLGSAFANLYVSTFEGFGIPIIEAFQAGVPVITSNSTSMPEVAGDAALLADPFSIDSIAQGITSIWSDTALREQLMANGRRRASKFTWQRTSDLLWQSLMTASRRG